MSSRQVLFKAVGKVSPLYSNSPDLLSTVLVRGFTKPKPAISTLPLTDPATSINLYKKRSDSKRS